MKRTEKRICCEQFARRGDFVSYGNSAHYLLHPDEHGFIEDDVKNSSEDTYTGVGVVKSVRVRNSVEKTDSS